MVSLLQKINIDVLNKNGCDKQFTLSLSLSLSSSSSSSSSFFFLGGGGGIFTYLLSSLHINVLSVWTFQTHSDDPNWPRWTFHELNSPSFARLTKSSTFGLGLTCFFFFLNGLLPWITKAQFRRRSFHEPNLIHGIRNAYFNLERLSPSSPLAQQGISTLERLWDGFDSVFERILQVVWPKWTFFSFWI